MTITREAMKIISDEIAKSPSRRVTLKSRTVRLDEALCVTPDLAVSHDYVAWCPNDDCYVNLAGNYDYLELPYYVSQDYEGRGEDIHPTCQEMIDAYVTPLLLVKARLAGMQVPEHYISNGYFEPPVVIDPVNPFMSRSQVVLKPGRENAVAKSMTRNFTYAICCQDMPPGSRVVYFRSVLGWSSAVRYRQLSRHVWDVFRIPLARVRAVLTEEGDILLSDISQLPFERLRPRERAYLEGRVIWAR
jgi:hypothetical protein